MSKHPEWVGRGERRKMAFATKFYRLMNKVYETDSQESKVALAEFVCKNGAHFVDMMGMGSMTIYTSCELDKLADKYIWKKESDASAT